MPVTPTYPGVYIEELASGVHPIAGVATSITAFAGFAPKGPVDSPITVQSFTEYGHVFGGVDRDAPACPVSWRRIDYPSGHGAGDPMSYW